MPLDPNIFFQGAALKQANDARTQQIVGDFFNTLIKSRQNQMPDIEKEAMAGLYTLEAGGQPTPQQQAALGVWQKLRASEQMFDPATQSVIPKYNMGVFGTLAQARGVGNYTPTYPPIASASPAMNMDAGGIKPTVDDIGIANFEVPPVGYNYEQVAGMPLDQREMARGALPTPTNPRQAQTSFEAKTSIGQKAAEADIAASAEAAKQYAGEQGLQAAKSEARIKGLGELARSMDSLIALSEEAPSGVLANLAAEATNLAGKPSKGAVEKAKLESATAITGLQSRIEFLKGQGSITDSEAKTAMAFLPTANDSREVKVAKIMQAREYILSIIENRQMNFVDQNTRMPGFRYLGTE